MKYYIDNCLGVRKGDMIDFELRTPKYKILSAAKNGMCVRLKYYLPENEEIEKSKSIVTETVLVDGKQKTLITHYCTDVRMVSIKEREK